MPVLTNGMTLKTKSSDYINGFSQNLLVHCSDKILVTGYSNGGNAC